MKATQTATLSKPQAKKPVSLPKPKAKRVQPEAAHEEPQKTCALMCLTTHQTGKDIQFEICADPDCKVCVAGTFNNWNPSSHPLKHHPAAGVFRGTFHLPAGKHEYKFVVNGEWQLDPQCPNWEINELGTLNSVIHV